MQSSDTRSDPEEIEALRSQVETLTELLQLYEQSAIEQEQRLQKALKELEERARQLEHAQATRNTVQSILESMGDAVVVVDQAEQVLFINPAAQRMLNCGDSQSPFEQWVQENKIFCSDGVTPYPAEQLPLMRAVQGESLDSVELVVIDSATGSDQWLSANARPLQNESHQITGAVAVFRNITQRKQSELALQQSHENSQKQAQLLTQTLQELRQTQAQLIHGEKMASLGQTVAGIAHEINNPVTFIHGNLKHAQQATQDLFDLIALFQTEYPQPTVAIATALADIDLPFLAQDLPKLFSSMQIGAERISNIVKSLRVFSRLDEADFKAIDIHASIDSTLVILQNRLRGTSNQPDIVVHRNYGDLPPVGCYASQLNQVFMHLLTNAIDALQVNLTQPQISIQTQTTADAILIHIADNGTGIPQEILPKIFDPFFTTKPVGKGTGLGLSVCYQIIVDQHKGRLECCSQVGEGTQFLIKLPR